MVACAGGGGTSAQCGRRRPARPLPRRGPHGIGIRASRTRRRRQLVAASWSCGTRSKRHCWTPCWRRFRRCVPMLRLLRKLGTSEAVRLAHLLVQPANTMVDRAVRRAKRRECCCWATQCTPMPRWMRRAAARSGFLMTMLGQDYGWPVPVGGSGQLTAALVKRACSAGARIECSQNVSRIEVRGGRAVGRDHRRGSDGPGAPCGGGRRDGAAVVLRHAANGCGSGRPASRARALRVGSAGGEGQLRAGQPRFRGGRRSLQAGGHSSTWEPTATD